MGAVDDARRELPLLPPADRHRGSTGAGHRRGSAPSRRATWLPDSRHFLFAGTEAGPRRSPLRPGDRRREAAADRPGGHPDRASRLRRLVRRQAGGRDRAGPQGRPRAARRGSARALPGVAEGEVPLRFSADGRSVYLWKRGTSRPASRASTSRPASARSGRTCCPPIPRGWSASRTCWSPPTARATRMSRRILPVVIDLARVVGFDRDEGNARKNDRHGDHVRPEACDSGL